jgi:putative heme-binding domain-containing protein
MRTLIRSTPGDAFRGIEVHKKLCGQCHKLYGEGQEVGPDITVNGRSSFEQLLSNVFDPSLVIGASYQGRTVLTKQGRVLSGLLAEDSSQRIVLKVQGGKQEIIPREDVEEFKVSEVSLMPEDVEKTLKPQEIADLFAFLTLDRPPSDPKARQLPGVKEVQPRSSVDPAQFPSILGEVAPGFTTAAVGEGGVALVKEFRGRPTVVRTHPVDMRTPCVLTGSFAIPSGQKTRLQLAVGHHQPNGDKAGDWKLTVKADGQTLYDDLIGPKTAKNGWLDLSLDLSRFAGKTVKLELMNHPNDWYYEFAYWGRVDVISE